jgi:hypothetical protein
LIILVLLNPTIFSFNYHVNFLLGKEGANYSK